MNGWSRLFWFFAWLLVVRGADNKNNGNTHKPEHTSNWAVLVGASAYWFNYRHIANVLSVYRTVKALGIPDDQIILMIADDIACNPRNIFPGTVINNELQRLNLYGKDIQVDYRGDEVTVENVIRVLTNRMPEGTARSKLLNTDENSNILVYMTGHGGANFLKFRDNEEISSHDLADAFNQMWEKRRYREILFMIDTCQAGTMYEKFTAPNILAMASSKIGESSYSYTIDHDVGVSVIDRWTFQILDFMNKLKPDTTSTMADLMDSFSLDFLGSTPVIREDLYPKPITQVPVMDFFGNIQRVEAAVVPYDTRGIMKVESFEVVKEFLEQNRIERVDVDGKEGRIDERRPVYLWRNLEEETSWLVILIRLGLALLTLGYIWKRITSMNNPILIKSKKA